ncbi:putative SOS response-associated peptidase YedK [Scopulibacillus daqui]|uniref:Abasic site processing protein n=1 Tax=Scopulibacillus daqui TaxID=1469162 RepID=A0ABS2Q0T9_9BACL|nr:SOS response-associated peptidase [Scopulibacillus daqui]MBM7645894.1 putative SOS response-associated peptidase YedK [Scopulibacillus daqui]
MCGRFTFVHELNDLFAYYNIAQIDLPFDKRYNIAPSQNVLAVVNDGNNNRIGYLKWGLIPAWTKDPKAGYKMINARAETIDEKPAYRRLLKRRRCIIPADSFFEWRKANDKKIPMRIKMKDDSIFSFAGLWDRWENNGQMIQSCTIITTAPNDLMKNIHDRMPAILSKDAESAWLDRSIDDEDCLKSLLTPYDANQMEAYEVSTLVNSPKNDVEEVIEKV